MPPTLPASPAGAGGSANGFIPAHYRMHCRWAGWLWVGLPILTLLAWAVVQASGRLADLAPIQRNALYLTLGTAPFMLAAGILILRRQTPRILYAGTAIACLRFAIGLMFQPAGAEQSGIYLVGLISGIPFLAGVNACRTLFYIRRADPAFNG